MNWKQLVITDKIDDQIERLKEALGYKAKWKVIQEALNLLEQKIENKQRLFIMRTLKTLVDLDLRETRNTKPLLGLIYNILSDTEISEDDKDKIIVAMIEAGISKKKQYKARYLSKEEEEKAEEEANELFEKLEKSGMVGE